MNQISDFGFRISDWKTGPEFSRNPQSVAPRPHLLVLLALLVPALLIPAMVWACPDCKEALFDPSQLQHKLSTARGYAISIGMFLSVPAGLVGGLTMLILKSRRR